MRFLSLLLTQHLLKIPDQRKADFVIGGAERPYLLRWWLLPRNRFFNVYLHCFLRSDDDRALHDHPWSNASLVLSGRYIEHTTAGARSAKAGDWRVRLLGSYAHRIELIDDTPAWTLFITGPRYRSWGFLCPQGWVPWERFTARDDKGAIGRGCD
jgi:hypothetical protein